MTTCEATRKDGQPCTVRVVGDGCLCFAHSPDLQARRIDARRRGGENRATAKRLDKLVPASLRPAIAMMFTALQEVHDGTLTPAQAQAMAALAGAIGRLYQTGVLEERLSALEERSA